jgi:hypothetical protein
VNVDQDISGFEAWTYVRVSQRGNAVTASFVDADAAAWSVRFAATTETSAVLEPGQTLSGPYIVTECVFGLGDISQSRPPRREGRRRRRRGILVVRSDVTEGRSRRLA